MQTPHFRNLTHPTRVWEILETKLATLNYLQRLERGSITTMIKTPSCSLHLAKRSTKRVPHLTSSCPILGFRAVKNIWINRNKTPWRSRQKIKTFHHRSSMVHPLVVPKFHSTKCYSRSIKAAKKITHFSKINKLRLEASLNFPTPLVWTIDHMCRKPLSFWIRTPITNSWTLMLWTSVHLVRQWSRFPR